MEEGRVDLAGGAGTGTASLRTTVVVAVSVLLAKDIYLAISSALYFTEPGLQSGGGRGDAPTPAVSSSNFPGGVAVSFCEAVRYDLLLLASSQERTDLTELVPAVAAAGL